MRGVLYEIHLIADSKYRCIYVRGKDYNDAASQIESVVGTPDYEILAVDKKGV